jgi:hypothetical protein
MTMVSNRLSGFTCLSGSNLRKGDVGETWPFNCVVCSSENSTRVGRGAGWRMQKECERNS